jgi:hypothetical protein
MGHQAWNIFTDWEYQRQRLWDEYQDDAQDAEAIEQERKERDRYALESEPFVIRGES